MTILIFIICLALLILIHEFGHFFAAKRFGVRVDEFGFGFPPRIFGKKRGETVYSFNWIPFGGFVKIFGEEGEAAGDPQSFSSQSAGRRAWIVVAGVFMNMLAAVLILTAGNIIGLPTLLGKEIPAGARDVAIRILDVRPASPAAFSGFRVGDEILSVRPVNESLNIAEIEQFQSLMREFAGKEINVSIRRQGKMSDLILSPRQNPPEGEGPIGVTLGKTAVVSYPWYTSLWRGIKDVYIISWQTISGFALIVKSLFVKGRIVGEVVGPVGIVALGSSFVGLGISYLMYLVALISINLAIINLLPFPALDGGRILFLAIEKLRGRRVDHKTEAMVHRVGFALLLALIVFITVRDIGRFF